MKKFTFTGTAAIKRKFKVEIYSNNYENAQDMALNLLDDVESEHYTIGDDEVEVEIDSYEESLISSQLDRYEPIEHSA